MRDCRMVNHNIVSDEKFLNLSYKARVLYFASMEYADDDGFITNLPSITRSISKDNDSIGTGEINELVTSGYLLRLVDCYAVTHWGIHNTIDKRIYKPTTCTKQLAEIEKIELPVLDKRTQPRFFYRKVNEELKEGWNDC